MRERRCFIISAFGRDTAPPGSEMRVAADRATGVIAALIEPALRMANETIVARGGQPLTCHRGDYSRDTQSIIDDIHENLFHATINIAALLTKNENVAYEIGVAKAIGRPVVLLCHEDYSRPFDLAHLRMVMFRDAAFDDGPYREKVRRELAETILEQLPNVHAPNFQPHLLRGDAVPPARCVAYDRFRPAYARWDEQLWKARKHIWLAGISLDQVAGIRKFRRPVTEDDREDLGLEPVVDGIQQYTATGLIEAMIAQCMVGRDVNILIMHEDSHALPDLLMHPYKDAADQLPAVRLEIDRTTRRILAAINVLATKIRSSDVKAGNFRFTKVIRGLITNRVSMSDDSAYITPVFLTLDVNSGPCFFVTPLSAAEAEVRKDTAHGDIELFGTVRNDLAFLQRVNPTIRLHRDGSITDNLHPSGERATG